MKANNVVSLAVATIAYACVGPMVKMIDLTSGAIACGRALFAMLALAAILAVGRTSPFAFGTPVDFGRFLLMGALMSGNWLLYFVAVKVSTVAVAVLSLFTYPLITSLLEPVILKEPLRPLDVAGAAFVVLGVLLIVPRFELGDRTLQGAVIGVCSGLCFSLYSLANRRFVSRYPVRVSMFWQFAIAALLFAPFAAVSKRPVTAPVVAHLIVLGAVLTTLAQLLFVNTLKTVPASAAAIFISLQPLFTVFLAFILVHEVPTARTMIGGAVICVTVICVTASHLKNNSG